jgi:hypothetical protein
MNVPLGYFDNFSDSVLELIHEEDFLASLPRKMPFEVETSYFDSLEISILAQIKAEKNRLPLPKTMPFALPIGYFEGLENELKAKIEIQKKEIKPLRATRPKTQVFSIAASIILFLGIGFLFLVHTICIFRFNLHPPHRTNPHHRPPYPPLQPDP